MVFRKKNLKCIFHADGRIELLEDMQVDYAGCLIEVPSGFTCDGSSIPRIMWRVCGAPRTPGNLKPGIFHDYMYAVNMFDRDQCDLLYYKALRSCGKSFLIAKLMYYAVRTFGGSHY